MQMVINLAPVSLSNKKVNFYTCPRLTFLKKNVTENAYKSISEPLDFTIFCLVLFWSLATVLVTLLTVSTYTNARAQLRT